MRRKNYQSGYDVGIEANLNHVLITSFYGFGTRGETNKRELK